MTFDQFKTIIAKQKTEDIVIEEPIYGGGIIEGGFFFKTLSAHFVVSGRDTINIGYSKQVFTQKFKLKIEGNCHIPLYMSRLNDCSVDIDIAGGPSTQLGAVLINSRTTEVTGKVFNIGDPRPSATGQSYGFQITKDCAKCTARDMEFSNVRWGVSLSGVTTSTTVKGIRGDAQNCLVDVHEGVHYYPHFEDLDVVFASNGTHKPRVIKPTVQNVGLYIGNSDKVHYETLQFAMRKMRESQADV